MEIQALLTASVAKPSAVKAGGPNAAVEGGEGDFQNCLQEAQAALGAPVAELPTGEAVPGLEGIEEVAVPVPVPPSVPVPSLSPALAAQLQTLIPPPPPATPPTAPLAPMTAVPTAPVATGTVAPATMAAADSKRTSGLPEAPVPMEISVKVVDVEPLPPASLEKAATELLDNVPAIAKEASAFEDEEAPEPEGDPAAPDAPKIEAKGEMKTETPLRVEGPAKTESVRTVPRLDTHNVVRELANRIELMAAAKSPQGVMIQLEPLDLGSITLLVKPESGGAVSADIGASNDQVRQALQGSQQTLQRQLELRGVAVANVSVSAQTQDRNPQQQGQAQQFYQPRQFHQPHSSTYSASSYGSPEPVARPTRLKAAGVDLWI